MRTRERIVAGVLAALVGTLALPAGTRAQAIGSEWEGVPEFQPSAELFTFELRVGAYRPNLEPAFTNSFGGDLGPLLSLELDAHLFRIPYVGPVAIGANLGWVEWTGTATSATTTTANVGQTGMSLVPMALLAMVRIDGLARELSVPIVITPKLGLDFGYWQTGTTGVSQAEGWSVGLRWAVQVALELDFLEPRAARRVDATWGINHTVVFFEFFGSTMGTLGSGLPVGSDLAWVAGLGVTF